MKRIHLFEVEDQNWFPNSLRMSITRLIKVMHRFLNTEDHLAKVLSKLITETKAKSIVDCCSGSGGPMPNVLEKLKTEYRIENLQLTLTDLYPSTEAAAAFNAKDDSISYDINPVDVLENKHIGDIKTLICSFHHMEPVKAKAILKKAIDDKQAICIYEMSDNSAPKALWWIAIPINIISSFIITLFSRPVSLKQLFFTYLIPLIPICFAWDGAVSNIRTYTLDDLDELLKDLPNENYVWEKGVIKGKGKSLFLTGRPV
jgi:hypothetical protein